MKENKLVATELTAKRFKLQTMLSVTLIVIGSVWMIIDLQSVPPNGGWGWVLGVGVLWYLVNRFRAWWHHG